MQLSNRNPLPYIIITAIVLLTSLILTSKYYLFAFLPSLAIAAYLVLLRYPQLGIYALVFLIPFGAFRKFDVAGITVNISWLIAAPLLFIVLLQTMVGKSSFVKIRISLLPWFGLFFLIEIISTWLSPYTASAVHETKLWLASFLYIALLAMLITRKGFFDILPSILISSVFLSSLLGNLGFFFDISVFTGGQFNGTFSRNLGGAIDANNLSLMVIACIPLIVYRYFYSKVRGAKLFYALILANSVLAVGTSYSRGGMLIFLVACVLIMWEYRHFFSVTKIGFALLALIVGASVFVSVMPQSFWQRQLSLTSKEDTSLNRRAAYIGVAMNAFIQRPIFGSGPDSFYHLFALTPHARISKETGERLGRYAHNTYLEILVGTGLSGLFVFLVILGRALFTFSQVKKRYWDGGKIEQAHLIGSYRLFLFIVLLYLMIFSESHHKFMLLGLVLSQIAFRLSNEDNHNE
jgi:O-antigen ligase